MITTAAGRALLERLGWFASEKADALHEGVVAIEVEAQTILLDGLEAAVEGLDGSPGDWGWRDAVLDEISRRRPPKR